MIIDIYDYSDLRSLQDYIKPIVDNGFNIGLFSGAWDMLHYYHTLHLQMAKRLCFFLVVGVGTDRLVRHDKGKGRPIYPENHRLGIINSIKYVDACFLMDSEADFGLVANKIIEPNNGIIFKNEDWLPKLKKIPGYNPKATITMPEEKDISESLYGNVIIIPDVDNTSSTTDFIKKIRSMET